MMIVPLGASPLKSTETVLLNNFAYLQWRFIAAVGVSVEIGFGDDEAAPWPSFQTIRFGLIEYSRILKAEPCRGKQRICPPFLSKMI
jgi:hypothetical protein